MSAAASDAGLSADQRQRQSIFAWRASGILWHLAAVLSLILVGVVFARFAQIVGVIGYSLVILGTALVVGGGIGFLFAIPRVVPTAVDATATATTTATRKDGQRWLTTNNNLEKVSDWLTTMLVGVGLTQLGNLNASLSQFRDFLAASVVLYPADRVAPAGALPVIGPMLLVAGVVLGFIYFYSFTRIVVTPELNRTEAGLAGEVVKDEAAARTIKDVADAQPPSSSAARAVVRASAPTVKDSLRLMFDALYEPGGYMDALKIADALRQTAAVNDPDYWFYSAAAWGQKMSRSQGEERQQAEDAALEAARRAVSLSPSYRARLWQISDPAGFDNDLAPLLDNPEFRRIVGK